MLPAGDPPDPGVPWGYPTKLSPSRNVTKSSPMGAACPTLAAAADAKPRNPLGEQIRTQNRRRVQLRGRRYRQMTTSPNRPSRRPKRSPHRAVRIMSIPALRDSFGEHLRTKVCWGAGLWQATSATSLFESTAESTVSTLLARRSMCKPKMPATCTDEKEREC